MLRWDVTIVTVLVAGCGSSSEICDPQALADALGSASAGDVVRVGDCSIAGSFDVPAGVTLSGLGADRSTLVGPAGTRAVTLNAGATALLDMTVDSRGTAAIVATGLSTARIERVRVEVTSGVGIAAENLDGFVLQDVDVRGPIGMSAAATHGVVLIRVQNVELLQVTVVRMGTVGVLAVESRMTWNDGAAVDNRGTGLLVEDGTVDLTAVELRGTAAADAVIPAWNGVFLDGALVSTDGLEVADSAGFGILHLDTPEADHVDLDVHDNEDAGLWVERNGRLDVAGTFTANGFAGLVAVDASNLSIHDTIVASTVAKVRVLESVGGPVEVGDGIQLVRSSTATSLTNVTLTNNARLGVLFELDGAALSAAQLTNVSVSTNDPAALGVLAQNGTTPPGWDDGVTRTAALAAQDATAGLQDTVGLIGPCERPAETDLGNLGLSALVP